MKKFLAILCLALTVATAVAAPMMRPNAVAIAGDILALTSKGHRSVLLYSTSDNQLFATIAMPTSPTGVAASADGEKLYVTTFENGIGGLHLIDIASRRVEKSVVAPSGAEFPVVDGGKIYVMAAFAGSVDEYDGATLAPLRSVKVLREPSAAALTDKYLFVANALPATAANGDFVSSEVSMVDRATFKTIKTIPLANGSNALRSMLLTADKKYILVSHNLGRYTVPTTQLQQGWMNTSAISVIDAKNGDFLGSIIVDEPNRGAAGTWGIAQSGDHLIVSHSGTHDVSVIDYPEMIAKLRSYKAGTDVLAYDLRFLYGMRERVPLAGNGPRLMAVRGDKVYVPTYFSDQLNILDMNDNTVNSIALNAEGVETLAQKGEKIFNDASYCYQNWQSCNGCHPGDGRTDGMNWDLQNDGIGNSKNCKSLLYSIQTPPSMISGIRVSAQLANRKGFTHIQFSDISETDALAIDQYVMSLEAVPSPYLVNGKLSEKAEKGKKIYEKLRCDDCHSGPYYTDLKMYRIGEDVEFEKGWDTPTLREVWRTAPYLFDGRAATMQEVFSVHKHGIEKKISAKEIEELTEYINSL